MSLLDRFRYIDTRAREPFAILHIPGLIYSASGAEGGHARLFGKPPKGITIYAWNQHQPDWPLIERWYIPGLLTIARVTPGTDLTKLYGTKQGWHLRWAKLKFTREQGGFSVRWTHDKGYSL